MDSPTILVLMITLEDLRNIRECLLVGFLEYFSHNSTGIMEEALRDKKHYSYIPKVLPECFDSFTQDRKFLKVALVYKAVVC